MRELEFGKSNNKFIRYTDHQGNASRAGCRLRQYAAQSQRSSRTCFFFTRNVVLLKDNSGCTGIGEVPGGERIRQTLEDSKSMVIGQPIGEFKSILGAVQRRFANLDSGGRGIQTFDPKKPSMVRPRQNIKWR
jgi:hypothetical protein